MANTSPKASACPAPRHVPPVEMTPHAIPALKACFLLQPKNVSRTALPRLSLIRRPNLVWPALQHVLPVLDPLPTNALLALLVLSSTTTNAWKAALPAHS